MGNGEVKGWVLLRDAYREMAPELVAPADQCACTAYRMLFGEDETFDEVSRRWAVRRPSRSASPRPTPRPPPPRVPGTSRFSKPVNAPPPRPGKSS